MKMQLLEFVQSQQTLINILGNGQYFTTLKYLYLKILFTFNNQNRIKNKKSK